MRALAALTVLALHVTVFSSPGSAPAVHVLAHLNVGVTVFFLISGFLLYRPFIAHRAGGAPAAPVRRYAWRRILRIFPAYWLVLTLLTVLPGFSGVTGGHWLSQYALLDSLALGSGNCVEALNKCGLAHTWSLGVEVGFYALLPLFALVAERLARRRSGAGWVRRELGILALLSLISILLHLRSSGSGVTGVITGTLLGYWLWFAAGMALAVLSVGARHGARASAWMRLVVERPWVPWVAALAVYGLLSALLPPTPFLFSHFDQTVTYVGFALVAALLMAPAVFGDRAGGMPRRFLAQPVMAWLGLVSYGIFLWHYAVVLRLGVPGSGLGFWPLLGATVAIAVACATLSYYGLERPLLRLKNRSRKVRA
ncbi:MAG: acyltransferase family protein [Solirubrobacteraceae bacterium]